MNISSPFLQKDKRKVDVFHCFCLLTMTFSLWVHKEQKEKKKKLQETTLIKEKYHLSASPTDELIKSDSIPKWQQPHNFNTEVV